eukprot:jgi/Chlat1/2055/Chrsp17S02527
MAVQTKQALLVVGVVAVLGLVLLANNALNAGRAGGLAGDQYHADSAGSRSGIGRRHGRRLGSVHLKKPSGEATAETKREHIQFDPILTAREALLKRQQQERHQQHEQHHGEDDDHHDWHTPEHEHEWDPHEESDTADDWDAAADYDLDELDHYGLDEDFEDHFDVLKRIQVLFPRIDEDNDGVISGEEMIDWHVDNSIRSSHMRTRRELQNNDVNHDGYVTLIEYIYHTDNESTPLSEEEEWIKSSKTTFELADEDHNGRLNVTEFRNFLHPEDSNNTKLEALVRRNEIKHRDTDLDGKLNLQEFKDTMAYELADWPFKEDRHPGSEAWSENHPGHHDRHNDEEHDWHDPHRSVSAKETQTKFTLLDSNKDGFIQPDELIPVMEILQPSEQFYAKEQALHVMQEADDNHDGVLTLPEMENNPNTFYHTALSYEDEYYHDEF